MIAKEKAQALITNNALAKMLNISYQGVVKKLKTNKELLSDYLVVNEQNQIIGIENEGLEALKNLGVKVSVAKQQEQEINKSLEIEQLKQIIANRDQEIEHLKELVKAKEQTIDTQTNNINFLQSQVSNLTEQLEYKNKGFIARLLTNKGGK